MTWKLFGIIKKKFIVLLARMLQTIQKFILLSNQKCEIEPILNTTILTYILMSTVKNTVRNSTTYFQLN